MGKSILIVDDAMFMRRIIKEALSDGGYQDLLEARDGEEAVTVFKKEKPELVLLDITMPGKSGMEVLEEILNISPQCKVIMCSSIGQEETIRRAVRLGAVDFVVKPFQKDKLVAVVQKYLG